jgi:hypothetical protein
MNLKIAAKLVESTLIGYVSNAKAYRCWFRESRQIVDLYHVTFIEHLGDQTPGPLPSVGMSTVPNVGENVMASLPPIQPTDDDIPSLLPDGVALLPAPNNAGMDTAPRRSARNQVPAPSWEDSNDSLIHGQEALQALNQVHEAVTNLYLGQRQCPESRESSRYLSYKLRKAKRKAGPDRTA